MSTIDDNADYCPNSIRTAATWPDLFTSGSSEKEIKDIFKRAVSPRMTLVLKLSLTGSHIVFLTA